MITPGTGSASNTLDSARVLRGFGPDSPVADSACLGAMAGKPFVQAEVHVFQQVAALGVRQGLDVEFQGRLETGQGLFGSVSKAMTAGHAGTVGKEADFVSGQDDVVRAGAHCWYLTAINILDDPMR